MVLYLVAYKRPWPLKYDKAWYKTNEDETMCFILENDHISYRLGRDHDFITYIVSFKKGNKRPWHLF